MTNESTEAVLQLCLQTQHENTKRRIIKWLEDSRHAHELNCHEDTVVLKTIEWIEELKVEDTK